MKPSKWLQKNLHNTKTHENVEGNPRNLSKTPAVRPSHLLHAPQVPLPVLQLLARQPRRRGQRAAQELRQVAAEAVAELRPLALRQALRPTAHGEALARRQPRLEGLEGLHEAQHAAPQGLVTGGPAPARLACQHLPELVLEAERHLLVASTA